MAESGNKWRGSGPAIESHRLGRRDTDDVETGAQADATRLFDRQLWAGLASPIGEFRVGRQNTAVFYKGSYIDNTTRTLGSVINAFEVPTPNGEKPF